MSPVTLSTNRAFLGLFLGAILAGPAPAQEAVEAPNLVCNEASRLAFRTTRIGTQISGIWNARAPGIGFTQGIQTFSVNISMDNGRLYLMAGGRKIAMSPIQGVRKELRWDFRKGQRIAESAQATPLSLEDIGLMADCELAVAPQYQWSMGSGQNASAGIYSFVSPTMAIGTMWNSAGGTREVILTR